MNGLLAFARRVLLSCLLGLAGLAAFPGAAQAAGCAPATGQGTAPADFRTYCWLDLSAYNDTTARGNNGQLFSFTLPDNTTVSFRLKSNAGGTLTSAAVPSWPGSAFGNSAFTGIPGKPILYQVTDGATVTVTISNISVVPPTGGTAQYSMIVGDGESSNAGESLVFTTTGNNWTRIATIQNGTSTTYPTVAGEGTKTVTETGATGTVGSFVWRSDGNPSQITAKMVGSGLQGVIIGMRYASVSVVSQIATTRYNAADQFTYRLGTNTGTILTSASTTGTAVNGFLPASVPTVAASYPFVVSQVLAAGSVGTLSNYTTSLTCTNSATGSSTTMPTNVATNSYTFTSLAYGDAILCTFTNTPIFNSIVGTVYNDANHNGGRDGTEGGPGVTGFYVKSAPYSGSTCGTATQAVQADPTTGAYTLPNLAQGNYCVILDNNNTLSDVTPTVPTGWLPTEAASGLLIVSVPAGSPIPPPQDFGVFNGSRLAGTVFADTGTGAGTANNGAKDGSETGIGNVTVTAKSGATVVVSGVTAGDGTFTLWVPATATGTLTVSAAAPAGYQASGGSAGTTGGTYTRPNVSYTVSAGQLPTGVLFGLIPASTLMPNGAQTAQAGTVVFYPHIFTPGSGGQVTFSVGNVSYPANPTWNTIVYRDNNCSGSLDGTEPPLTAAVTMTAGVPVCVVVKQFVPAGLSFGAQGTATLTASVSYTNANPALSATLTATDVTTVGERSELELRKTVQNITRGGAASTSVVATPGEVLQYTLTAQNSGGGTVTTLVINDATPAFTTYVSAACPGSLPAGITACAVSTQPAVGAQGGLQWTFTGALSSGAQLVVTYQVKLSQ